MQGKEPIAYPSKGRKSAWRIRCQISKRKYLYETNFEKCLAFFSVWFAAIGQTMA
jgi:hypothetical protein